MQRAASATSTWANRESAPERADGAAKCELTQALVHGRRGPHTWALGDCCILGRCPTTHTPHTTPHAHTLRQHIGYERGHPPTQGPHQQSVSRETRAGWWEEVGVDARGHITRGRAPKGTRSLPSRNPAGWGGKDPVRNPITQHEHPQVAMKRVRWNREEGERGHGSEPPRTRTTQSRGSRKGGGYVGWVGEMWTSVCGGKGEGVRHHVAVTTGTYLPNPLGRAS